MKIHETAFIISTYRSYYENISKDSFAKLWNNADTDKLIPEILNDVSKHEALMHSIRNRFFYEEMNNFFIKNKGGTLLNFGSGFSMYQFSFSNSVTTIEIDKKEIVEYKKEKIDLWMQEGLLPHRDTQYLSIDFNTSSTAQMTTAISDILSKKPIFILIEGVLFFLDRTITNTLFEVFDRIQNPADQLGVVTYLPEIEKTAVYKRLLNYFDSNNITNDSFKHQTIPHSYFQDMDNYRIKEKTDEFELAQVYAPNHNIKIEEELLNETLYVLEKI